MNNIKLIVGSCEKVKIEDFKEAIKLSGKYLIDNNCVNEQYVDTCLTREKNYPTGLLLKSGLGVAIPHGNPEFIKEDSICILKLQKPILFYRMDDPDEKVEVSIIFHLAVNGNTHLEVLRSLVKAIQDEEFINKITSGDNESIQKNVSTYLSEEDIWITTIK